MTQSDTYSDEEATRRRDEALRRALNTPPPKPIAKRKRVKPALDKKRGRLLATTDGHQSDSCQLTGLDPLRKNVDEISPTVAN